MVEQGWGRGHAWLLALVFASVLLPAGAAAQLRINEIDYDQDSVDDLELLEIKNVGAEPVDLEDWDLEIGPVGHINLPPIDLPPGGYLVFCGFSGHPTPCDIRFLRRDNLADETTEVRIVDPQGMTIDAVTYALPSPAFADHGGAPGLGLSRCPEGTGDFVPAPITPHAANACDALVADNVTEAGTVGDQLLFFYDAREGRTTFIAIGNPSPEAALLEVVFYGQSLERVAEGTLPVPGGGARVIDPTLVANVPGTVGFAVVTPIASDDDHRPRVLQRPLVGSSTVANLQLGAGFGENPFGRLAVDLGPGERSDVPRAQVGAVVDGGTVRYQTLHPGSAAPSLLVPAYFDPEALAPVEEDGNRLVLMAFSDLYGALVGPGGAERFTLVPVAQTVSARLFDDDGDDVGDERMLALNGVHLDTLQGLAAGASLTRPGHVELTVTEPAEALDGFLGLFAQALGTFAVGQRLPSPHPAARGRLDEALDVGDQLLYLFDARPGRTTFLTVGNPNTEGVAAEVVFYSQDLSLRLAESTLAIPGRGVRVIDPTVAPFASAAGQAGMVTVTPVASEGDHTPVLHALPLAGGFTIVNLGLGAGFGQNPFGRLVVDAEGRRPAPEPGGTTSVDRSQVAYQAITPPASARALIVPVHFDPDHLAPVEADGNRLFLTAFRDSYAQPVGPGGAPRFHLFAEPLGIGYTFIDQNAVTLVDDGATAITGVTLTTLQDLAGGVVLDMTGRVELDMAPPADLSVLGLFSQAVGTFAVGQRLPAFPFP
jgi:hypothetical protein